MNGKSFNLDRQVEKWWIDDGEAVGEIFLPGFMSLWLTGELTWKNYSLSCRAKLVEDKNDPPSIGLTLHDRGEEDSRYLFFIDYVFGTVRLVKALRDSNWFPVIYAFDAEIDTWYELTATIHEDGTIEFKVDDEVFTVIDDDPLKGGQAGLVVADGRAHFDDVEITGAQHQKWWPRKKHVPSNHKRSLQRHGVTSKKVVHSDRDSLKLNVVKPNTSTKRMEKQTMASVLSVWDGWV